MDPVRDGHMVPGYGAKLPGHFKVNVCENGRAAKEKLYTRAHYIPGEKFGERVESEETTCLLDLHHKWVRAFKVCPVYGGLAEISGSLDSPLCQTGLICHQSRLDS